MCIRDSEKALYKVGQIVSTFTGIRIPANKPIIGANVFTQTAGIHADGDSKNNLYHNDLLPERFGRKRKYALGKTSGKDNIIKNRAPAYCNKLKIFSWAKKVYLDLKFIKGVRRTIAIGSGKGGVGKSSITVGIAQNLKKRGYKVGILDADVYGPNIPVITGLNNQDVSTKEEDGVTKFIAIDHDGLKIMSVAMLAKREQSLAWRGPILTRLLNQFLYQVDWGDLDFLLIDLPPGTGDTQITLLQDSPIIGVILVTLPGLSSYSDLIRTTTMYENFGMPIYGLVENMSFYKCPCCSHEEKLFLDELSMVVCVEVTA